LLRDARLRTQRLQFELPQQARASTVSWPFFSNLAMSARCLSSVDSPSDDDDLEVEDEDEDDDLDDDDDEGLDEDFDDEDEDEDEAGTIEFPGESREGDQDDRSAPAGNL
jgi:hypothetical protein